MIKNNNIDALFYVLIIFKIYNLIIKKKKHQEKVDISQKRKKREISSFYGDV